MVANAQNYFGITPMHKFLQKYADSTIVLQYTGGFTVPEYKILSKKGDTISTYIYKSEFKFDKAIREYPQVFRDSILKNNGLTIFFTPIDINRYFNFYYLNKDSLMSFWSASSQLKLWQINDDKVDGEGCKVKVGKDGIWNSVDDGGDTYLFLITKDEIKQLHFYAPDYYDSRCPGRKGRQTVLKLGDVFSEHFKRN